MTINSPRLLRCQLAVIGVICIASGSLGCQYCCRGTNAYSAIVDHVADHQLSAECLYCAKLDATRINRPGGCQAGPCCCPSLHCGSGVYAHRWKSPPLVATTDQLNVPEYPGDEFEGLPGPQVPPASRSGVEVPGSGLLEERATPLFERPITPSPLQSSQSDEVERLFPARPAVTPPAEPAAEPAASAVPEIDRMSFQRSESDRREPDASAAKRPAVEFSVQRLFTF